MRTRMMHLGMILLMVHGLALTATTAEAGDSVPTTQTDSPPPLDMKRPILFSCWLPQPNKPTDKADDKLLWEVPQLCLDAGFTWESGKGIAPWVDRAPEEDDPAFRVRPPTEWDSYSPTYYPNSFRANGPIIARVIARGIVPISLGCEASFDGRQFNSVIRFKHATVANDSTNAKFHDYTLTMAGQVNGRAITGTFTMSVEDGRKREGQFTGHARNTLSPIRDPLNGVYVLTLGQSRVVLEYRDGKLVEAAGLTPGVDLVRHKVDASKFKVELEKHALGPRGILSGELAILDLPGGQSWSYDVQGRVNVRGKCFGEYSGKEEQEFPRKERATDKPAKLQFQGSLLRLDDPLTKDWQRIVNAYQGVKPQHPDLLLRAKMEADTLPALPDACPANRYLHTWMRRGVGGNGLSHIYAPWFDMPTIPGAVRYRLNIAPGSDKANISKTPSASFTADLPTTSLAPIWKDLPPGPYMLKIIGLDADGKEVSCPNGQPADFLGKDLAFAQRKFNDVFVFVKRNPFDCPTWEPAIRPAESAVRCEQIWARDNLNNWHSDRMVTYKTDSRWWPSKLSAPGILAVASTDPGERAEFKAMADRFMLAYGGSDSNRKAPSYGFPFPWEYYHTWIWNAHHGYRAMGRTTRFTATPKSIEILSDYGHTLAHVQQSTGGFTATNRTRGTFVTDWSFFGTYFFEPCASELLLSLQAVRCGTGTDAVFAAEERAHQWMGRNTLRTWNWDSTCENGGGPEGQVGDVKAVLYVLYLLEMGHASRNDIILAEDVARFVENFWVKWDKWPSVWKLNDGTGGYDNSLTLAAMYAELYRWTGKPLYLAKAKALVQAAIAVQNPVTGLLSYFEKGKPIDEYLAFVRYNEHLASQMWHCDRILKEVIGGKPLLTGNIPANGSCQLALRNAVVDKDGPTPLRLNVELRGGKVIRGVASAPSWNPFFHPVDVSALRCDGGKLAGSVQFILRPAQCIRELRPWTPSTMYGLGSDPTVPATLIEQKEDVVCNYTIDVAPGIQSGQLEGNYKGRFGVQDRLGAVVGYGESQAVDAPSAWVWLKMDAGVVGGEAWQNWALASLQMKDKKVANARFSNSNAGWEATVEESAIQLTADGVAGRLVVQVKPGPKPYLANLEYEFSLEGTSSDGMRNSGLNGSTKWLPRPVVKAIYKNTWKPVQPGRYEFAIKGTRVGNLIAGDVECRQEGQPLRTTIFTGEVCPPMQPNVW